MIDHAAIARAARAAGGRGVTAARVAAAEHAERPFIDRQLATGAWAEPRRGRGGTEHPDLFGLFLERVLRRAGLRDAAGRRRAVDRLQRVHARVSLWRVPNREARPFLADLRRRRVPFGVVSNSDGRVERWLRLAGLRHLVPFVVDSGVFGVEKPDPRIFLEGCRRLGLPPRAVGYVGDIPSVDAAGARRAGLVPFLYDPPGVYRRRRGLHRIGRLADLLPFLAP